MSDRAAAIDNATLQVGLLMESAQMQQKSAEEQLEKLRAHMQDLDGVVREEIRRTLTDEMQLLSAESKRATDALQKLRRAASLRGILCSILMAVLSTGIPVAVMRWTLPSGAEVAALRLRRDALAASVANLENRGGRVSWRRCGATARLCVRVDRGAPSYGEKADYYVVAGD